MNPGLGMGCNIPLFMLAVFMFIDFLGSLRSGKGRFLFCVYAGKARADGRAIPGISF